MKGRATLAWSMTSRIRCCIEQNMASRRRKHPYNILAATGPDRAAIASECEIEDECARDKVAMQILKKYPKSDDILSAAGQATIFTAASEVMVNSAKIECMNAKGRRRVFGKHGNTANLIDFASETCISDWALIAPDPCPPKKRSAKV